MTRHDRTQQRYREQQREGAQQYQMPVSAVQGGRQRIPAEQGGQALTGAVRPLQQQQRDGRAEGDPPPRPQQAPRAWQPQPGRPQRQQEQARPDQDGEPCESGETGDTGQHAHNHRATGGGHRRGRRRVRYHPDPEEETAGDRMAVRGDHMPTDHVRSVVEPGTDPHHGLVASLPVPRGTVVHPLAGRGDDRYRAGVHRDRLAEGQRDPRRCGRLTRPPGGIAALEHGMRGRRHGRPDHGHEHGREQEANATCGAPPTPPGVKTW